MKYLGLDLGTRTLGVATSDPSGILASGYETYFYKGNDLHNVVNYVKMVCDAKKIDKIVLGLPKNMNGSLGFQSQFVLDFKKMLEETIPQEVILVDERLTTSQVTRIMIDADVSRKKRKQKVDKLAATLILQSYLDSIPKKVDK